MPLGPAEDVIIGGQGDLIAAMVRTIIQLTAEQAARLDRAAVDTSALLAYLDRDALRHAEIVAAMYAAFAEREALTQSYVLLETEALTRRWLGAVVARRLLEDVAPILEVAWVDADLHGAAAARLLASPRRRSSFVDEVSFELMRRKGVGFALTLDRDFAREGFALVP